MSERHRKRSIRSYRPSSGGRALLATSVGLLVGGATAAVLIAVGGLLGPRISGAWLAAVTPIASAMVAAAAAGSMAHWRKVGGHGAVYGAVVATALVVLLGAQLVRVAALAAHFRAGGVDALVDVASWRGAFDVGVLTAPGQRAPGVDAAAVLFGPDGVWVFSLGALVLVVGMALWMAGRALSSPLCVSCRAWCVRQRGVVERSGDHAGPDLVRQRAAARDWRFFRDLGPSRGGPSLRFDLCRCPSCNRSNALDVMWERPLWRDRRLVGDLRLGSDDVRTLLDLVDAEPKPA